MSKSNQDSKEAAGDRPDASGSAWPAKKCALCDNNAVTTAAHIPVCQIHFAEYAAEAARYLPDGERVVLRQLRAVESQRGRRFPDTELINWLEQNPLENLEAIGWQLAHGKARTVRESIEYHLINNL